MSTPSAFSWRRVLWLLFVAGVGALIVFWFVESQLGAADEELERLRWIGTGKELVECRSCDREISRFAKACPHCGDPRPVVK